MKLAACLVCLGLIYQSIYAQDCNSIYNSAKSLVNEGQYDLALKKLTAYKLCNPDRTKLADSLILSIYQTINAQKNEAIKQKNLANQRAAVIAQQRDSIEKENMANKIATQALQVNEFDPLMALSYVYAGLCFSSQNASLIEIKKRIISDEVLNAPLQEASNTVTTCVKALNKTVQIAGDANGKINWWDIENKALIKSINALNGSITAIEVIDYRYILISGDDSKDYKQHNYSLKLFDTKNNSSFMIQSRLPLLYNCLCYAGDSNNVYLSSENGTIACFSLKDSAVTIIKNDTAKITGLQCFQQLHKTFYATPSGIFDLKSDKVIYKSKEGVFITYFGLCQSTGDMYIGIGPDLILYNYFTQKDHLLYPIHKRMITSCHCADSAGGFLTTGLDNYAVLWTSNGSLKQALKGNKAELYDGYLSPDGNYAITAGRREMSGSINDDTATVKYWYLKGLLKTVITGAHFMGGTGIVQTEKSDLYISAGVNGNINIWDSAFRLKSIIKVTSSGISSLQWNEQNNKLIIGSFSGETGTIDINEAGRIGNMPVLQTHHTSAVTGLSIIDNKIYSTGKDGVLYVQTLKGERIDSVYFDVELNSVQSSPGKNALLISASNQTIVYDIINKSIRRYKHEVKVYNSAWLSPNSFITISGQYLRIWNVNNQQAPLLKMNNNIQNIMTSLAVDFKHKVIYTGTWSGYIICWDFSGRELFQFDQLTSLADTNIIQNIINDRDSNKVISIDYNGNIGVFYSPFDFLKKELNLNIDCNHILETVK